MAVPADGEVVRRHVEQWLAKQRSPATARAYRRDLDALLAFLEAQAAPTHDGDEAARGDAAHHPRAGACRNAAQDAGGPRDDGGRGDNPAPTGCASDVGTHDAADTRADAAALAALASADRTLVRKWRDDLQRRVAAGELAAATARRRLAAAGSLFDHLAEHGLRRGNPARRLWRPQSPPGGSAESGDGSSRPDTLTARRRVTLLAPPPRAAGVADLRDALLLHLHVGLGVRPCEAVRLRPADVGVAGAGGRAVFVPAIDPPAAPVRPQAAPTGAVDPQNPGRLDDGHSAVAAGDAAAVLRVHRARPREVARVDVPAPTLGVVRRYLDAAGHGWERDGALLRTLDGRRPLSATAARDAIRRLLAAGDGPAGEGGAVHSGGRASDAVGGSVGLFAGEPDAAKVAPPRR